MTKYLLGALVTAAAFPLVVAAEEAPPPKNVIKAREVGTVPTAVWLAECETLFGEFWEARAELDATVAAGGFAGEPGAYARALTARTIPAAQVVADFGSTYVPDTDWGRQLRTAVVDAMVSSLAADLHVVESLEGTPSSAVPLDAVLKEQKEMSADLIADVHARFLNAPEKYRLPAEELGPSREYYFQDFHLRYPGK